MRLDAAVQPGAHFAAMTVAAQPDNPNVQPEPEAPKPLSERLDALYDEFTSKADAAEPAAVAQPDAEGAATPPAGVEAKPDETPAAESWVAPTTEQLRDKAWWGGLSKEAWERAEREHPVEAAHVKAGQAAGTKIVNEARAEAERILAEARAAATSPQGRTTEPTEDEPSDELIRASEMTLSMDPKEVAKGHLLIAKLTAPRVAKEIGVDPNRNHADAVLAEALTTAAKNLPEIHQLVRNDADRAELDKIAETTPELQALIDTGTAKNIAVALTAAGRRLIERKTADAERATAAARQAEIERKKKEGQKVVQSNARPASADVLNPHGAMPAQRVPLRQKLSDMYDTLTRE